MHVGATLFMLRPALNTLFFCIAVFHRGHPGIDACRENTIRFVNSRVHVV